MNKKKAPMVGKIVIAIGVVLLVAITVLMSRMNVIEVILLFSAIVGGGFLLVRWGRLHKIRRARILAFAGANGLKYRENATPDGLVGLIFDEGRNKTVEEVLAFPDGFEIGRYNYLTGHGKNRQVHNYSYIRVALTRHLPNMVLDAKKNNFWKFTNLPDSFDRTQRLRLEGDFNEHFDLYVPKQYEQDALYVFTPDVMQALIASGKEFDMEVVNDELYFYSPAKIDLASETSIRKTLAMIDSIASELRQQSRRYSDERVANNTAGAMVAPPGQRLRSGFNPFIIVIIIVVLIYFLLQFIPVILGTM